MLHDEAIYSIGIQFYASIEFISIHQVLVGCLQAYDDPDHEKLQHFEKKFSFISNWNVGAAN
jgi:hypothetical protein